MAAGGPSPLIEAAREIQRFCEERRWPFCFIGGLAVQRWGEARLTRDADLVVFTGLGNEAAYLDELLRRFPARIADAREFAFRHRVLLVAAANGVPLDISLGALDFEERATAEASLEEIVPGERLRLSSPTALVVYKAFAGRAQDWLDLEGIIVKSGPRIDWRAAESQLKVLLDLKGDSTALARLAAMREKLSKS